MSVYDYIKVQHSSMKEEHRNALYKTYDTLSMHHDHYIVKEDGYLYQHSGLRSVEGRAVAEFVKLELTGEVVFGNEDVQYSAYFVKGRMSELHLLEGS